MGQRPTHLNATPAHPHKKTQKSLATATRAKHIPPRCIASTDTATGCSITCDLSKNLLRRMEKSEFDLMVALHDDPADTRGTKVRTETLAWITSPDHARHEQRPLSLVVAPDPCIYRNRVLQTLNRLELP